MTYSKKLTEFGVQYLLAEKEAIKRGGVPALPVSKTTGMRDAVMRLVHGYGIEMYADFHDRILMDSERGPNGYLKPRSMFMCDGYIITDDNRVEYEAFMEAYDKYLCTDGVIRYRPTPEGDLKYKALYEQKDKEFWEDIDACFKSMGYEYDEEQCCWIHPETGEEAAY